MVAHGNMAHDGGTNRGDHKHNTEGLSLVPSSRHRMFATTASGNQESRNVIEERKKEQSNVSIFTVVIPFRDEWLPNPLCMETTPLPAPAAAL